jgi:4-hydroxy-tetrahydrodipicolinate reductase
MGRDDPARSPPVTDAPAPKTIHVVVTGCAGRMGRMLARAVVEADGVMLAGCTERPGHPWIGRDAGEAMGFGQSFGIAVTDDPLPLFASAQAVLDFTAPAATVAHAELAAQARLVHVIGTTGLEAAHLTRIAACARHAAVVRSGNFSVGVTLMAEMVRRAAAALGPDWDVEIVEMHHRHKVDAPSGTALMLGAAAAAGRGVALAEAADRGRDGVTGPRGAGRIGFASLRGGDVVGEHEAVFAADGERLSFRHVATDRMLFARGAVAAALWGQGRPPGEYDMRDVLGLN